MKVILTRDVPQVGKDGEVVLVADGFARNYLFPRQLATVAKGALLKQHQNRLTREIARGAALLTSAQANGETLKDKQFLIVAKANVKSTRLFGAVTEADVAAVILKETGVEVDKRKISLIDPIKVTGIYSLTAKLHPDVVVPFTLDVATAEMVEAREKARLQAEERAAVEAAKFAAAEAAAKAAAEAAKASEVADEA